MIKSLMNNKTVRWILLIPAVMISFYACVLIAVAIYMAADALCPEHLIESGFCTAPYLNITKEALLLIAPALAAALMVLTAYCCAPSHKLQTAITTFVIGSCAALYYALDSGYWLTLALTETCSLSAIIYLYKANERT